MSKKWKYDYTDTIRLSDGRIYFPDKELRYGDITSVIADMMDEAEHKGVSRKLFTQFLFACALIERERCETDVEEMRAFIKSCFFQLDQFRQSFEATADAVQAEDWPEDWPEEWRERLSQKPPS